MLKFSLLVPIYNGERYLERLLSSMLSQDIPHSEYEIICVDDCSKDHSVEIIEKYQTQYSNIRLLRNKVNSRVATNINNMIAASQGKYFWMFGQDDYIEPNCLGKLYSRLEKDQLDILLFNYRRVYENETIQSECQVLKASDKQTGIEWIKYQFGDRDYCQYILGYTWRAVYRIALWREKNIRCVDGMNYEDTIIMLKAIVYAKAVASIEDMLYNYRINNSSITFRKDFVKRGDLIYEFAFMVGQEVGDYYNELKVIDGELAKNLYAHMLIRYNNFTFDLIRTPNEHKKVFYKCVEQNREFVKSKRQYLNWKARLLTNRIFGYPIACVAYRAYKAYKRLK